MISKTNLFNPNVLFVNKKHYLPKNEDYIFTKKITEIRNTPVSPSFGKRIIHVLTSLFHKLEIGFLIKDIKNNKLFDTVDTNKHSNIFNKIDEKNIEIEDVREERIEIKNKNLYAINNIISHANDKFDFYSFCDYLTEVKRAKDFFSGLDDIENEGSNSNLIVECLNEIIKLRISSIDDKSIKNTFKLINSNFNFENIHLNKKYDFMSNFSTGKERDNFIKSMNILLIGIEEAQVLDKFDDAIKNKIENKLSTIMMIALNKNMGSKYSFNDLMQEWIGKYISDNHNVIKRNTIVDTGTQVDTDITVDTGTQVDTNITVDTGTQIDTNITVDTGTQVDTNTTVDTATQIDTNTTVDTATQIDTNTTVDTATQIDKNITVDTGTQVDTNTTVDTDIQANIIIINDVEKETKIELSRPKEDLSRKYINIDDFDVKGNNELLKIKIDNISEIDEDDTQDIDDGELDNLKEMNEDDDFGYQWDYEGFNINHFHYKKSELNALMEKINNLNSELKSDEKFNKINNKLDSIILDIDDSFTEEETPLDLSDKLKFSPDNYQLNVNMEENTSEISEEDKTNKKL
ncbi:hypothetical protein [Proteus appendicitidis]|uniref:Uncharacterized protein n=1 Tax=Proteus appendicitidis TaxID=3034648 RepID=A0ABY8YB82_9GAMM|nr:hypothetical protein [Proteus sp. HZ0627]WIV89182.1 hypothetical protein QQS39_03975 [Proteus sp. HZ0627]